MLICLVPPLVLTLGVAQTHKGDIMSNAHSRPGRSQVATDLPVAILLAILPAGLVAAHIGWPTPWSGLSLPVSVLVFGLIWGIWMLRRNGSIRISILGLGLWACGIHLAMWLPLVLHSYIAGHGVQHLNYSILSSLITAAIVAWYILTDHLWQTLTLGSGLVGVVILLRSTHSKTAFSEQE